MRYKVIAKKRTRLQLKLMQAYRLHPPSAGEIINVVVGGKPPANKPAKGNSTRFDFMNWVSYPSGSTGSGPIDPVSKPASSQFHHSNEGQYRPNPKTSDQRTDD